MQNGFADFNDYVGTGNKYSDNTFLPSAGNQFVNGERVPGMIWWEDVNYQSRGRTHSANGINVESGLSNGRFQFARFGQIMPDVNLLTSDIDFSDTN